ncbi:hypothetical protein LZ30DRAFT_729640 [Colletotrichum cereale]|nr:hypothetical protein LZ30DRAFT_729640 [Colletotrichum cereale]
MRAHLSANQVHLLTVVPWPLLYSPSSLVGGVLITHKKKTEIAALSAAVFHQTHIHTSDCSLEVPISSTLPIPLLSRRTIKPSQSNVLTGPATTPLVEPSSA